MLKEIFNKNTSEPVEGFDRLMTYNEFENAVAETKEVIGSIPKLEGDVHIAMAILYWFAFRMENEKDFYKGLIKSLSEEINKIS